MPPRPDWRPYFGFEEPYGNQADAIGAAIDAGREGGYLAMEGPCGTGKTMAALTAGATLVREGDYERILVVTPVKQQRRQFVADLRALNEGLDDPLDGVALVGKADLCPYGREGAFPEGVGVQTRCEDLREATADLVESESRRGTNLREAAVRPDVGDDPWWDADRARSLVDAARRDAEERPLATAGADSPYPRAQPTAPEGMAAGDPLYCPFEADWYARGKGSPVGFAAAEGNVVTAGEYLPGATDAGTCPHRAMSTLLGEATVVIGNYNHLFDPRTRGLTAGLLDDDTFVIVDEAHRLEGRVRDLLSDTLGRGTLLRARRDVEIVLRALREGGETAGAIREVLEAADVPVAVVERARTFLGALIEWIEARTAEAVRERFDDPAEAIRRGEVPDEDVEVPLRDPEAGGPDDLTAWADAEGYDAAFFSRLVAVAAAVEDALEGVDPQRSPVLGAAARVLSAWRERDHVSYLRELELRYAEGAPGDPDHPWERAYAPRLVLYNCMPADELAGVLDALGGGVLMSATLEPLPVFREVSGLDRLADRGRPVVERTYELPFPEANRASWIVDAGRFTARERGDPGGEDNDTRERFARVCRAVARSPGNVMLCLPSYREAAWAADRLGEDVEKPVLLDRPSSAEETERLKREFVRGDGKVLLTSTRGTLTEGVDYEGDALGTCAVIGVPLVNVGAPRIRAVKRAYAEVFGEGNAFEYALTVPAVRRARQAIGRVIRGPEERGVRILADERYAPGTYNGVHEYLPEAEREEFTRMTPMFLPSQRDAFWG
ncbi:MAG: ATP-dependent DNA helicase [Halobacteriales archaeon]